MILGLIYYAPQKGFFLIERENLTPEKKPPHLRAKGKLLLFAIFLSVLLGVLTTLE